MCNYSIGIEREPPSAILGCPTILPQSSSLVTLTLDKALAAFGLKCQRDVRETKCLAYCVEAASVEHALKNTDNLW
jgi:hypothetical protein